MSTLRDKRLGGWIQSLVAPGLELNFVETGTYLGETAAWASTFSTRVTTIELSPKYFELARTRLSPLGNVSCLLGNSSKRLKDVVLNLRGRSIFWLDGHYSFGETAGELQECPVLEELDALKDMQCEYVVLIDDARYFTECPPAPHRAEDWPSLSSIMARLQEMDGKFHVSIIEDVIVAVPQTLAPSFLQFLQRGIAEPSSERLLQLKIEELRSRGQCVRLHLGCGETILEGYINIDFPSAHHNVMKITADIEVDVRELELEVESVDEVRLHHVLEHFDRVTALVMLIRWQAWLVRGGLLHIETPDFEGCAEVFCSSRDPLTRAGVVRHLAGDQAARWAFHLDHWYEERFRNTLSRLGYEVESVSRSKWPRPPFLANIEVKARKTDTITSSEKLSAADQVLWLSTVSIVEAPTHAIWRKQIRALLGIENVDRFIPPDRNDTETLEIISVLPRIFRMLKGMNELSPGLSIQQIHGYNAASRDAWVARKAKSVKSGARVLDVGAGTCPYRELFDHCSYVSHDFNQYEGYQGSEGTYGKIDIISDISNIPELSGTFDVVICTEVLEHVPEPLIAMAEMSRLLRPGGRLFATAPLGSGLHQEPYHFYGGYTPHWYNYACGKSGLEVVEISSNGGFFALLAQECARVAWTAGEYAHLHKDVEAIGHLFGVLLPRYLYQMDKDSKFDRFTAGYFVEAVKLGTPNT